MLTYQVDGLGCGYCAVVIGRAIAGVAPGAEIRIDPGERRLYLEGRFNPASVEAVVTAAGYAAVGPCRDAGGRC